MTFNINKYLEISQYVEDFSNYNKKLKAEIIVVSKNQLVEDIKTALNIGIRHFAEIKVQEAVKKYTDLKDNHKDIKLHMIGGLQTNKVKKALEIFDIFPSLDRDSLAKEFSKHPKYTASKIFFIQVNTGQEKQKSGIQPSLTSKFLQYCVHDLSLNIVGLMCLPPVDDDPKEHFSMLEDLALKNNLKQLSIGMSRDYKIAIKCGATFIRIGSSFFGGRK